MKSGQYAKLALARHGRTPYTEQVSYRDEPWKVQKLRDLSDKTGRSLSDLLRRAVTMLLTASEAATPFDAASEVKQARERQAQADRGPPPVGRYCLLCSIRSRWAVCVFSA